MARYSDTITDELGRPVEGAQVFVTRTSDKVVPAMTADGGAVLTNPLLTDAFGAFHFNAADGLYDLEIRFGGKTRWIEAGVAVGTVFNQDTLLRSNLAASSGAGLVGAIASGTGAVARTQEAKNRDFLHREDFGTLQQAVNAAHAQGKALYLGDTNFTQATTVTLPDGDNFIFGPGASILTITFTGTGSLFVGTGLTAATNIYIGGFRAVAGAPNCGRPVDIAFASSLGLNDLTAKIADVVAVGDATNYWTGGARLNNARNSIFDGCYTLGPTSDLTKTVDGFKVEGEATDVKFINCQAVSVGTGADLGGQAEGTFFANWVVVDALIGVKKHHTGASEPLLSMVGWHMNCRAKGFDLKDVLQVCVGPGLLYAQNTTGAFIGIHVQAAAVLNQDLNFDEVLIDAQLAGGGATTTTGLKVDGGNRISGRLMLRSLTTGVDLAAGVTNCELHIQPQSVATITAGAGFSAATNRCFINHPTLGYGLPATSGPYNPDTANVVKAAQSYAFGVDTTGVVKALGGYRLAGGDSNFTSATLELYARLADALTRVGLFGDKTIIFDRLAALNFADDTAAATGGVPLNGLYHNAGAVRIRRT